MARRKMVRKEQREAEEKLALWLRLLDMMRGANGSGFVPDPLTGEDAPPLSGELGIEVFGRWVGAIRREWARPDGEEALDGDGARPVVRFQR